jgi:two-component system sensor histidine kinase CpxA
MQVALALAQRKAAAENQVDLARIGQEAEKLDQLVGQILTLARLRSSPLESDSAVNLEEVVTEVVADARFEHPSVALEFTTEQLPAIQGNAGELGSAIENVLRNALLHAGASAEVIVALRRAGPSVFVTVADNGPGVPEEALSHLFEPFYRADPSRDHQQSGYGLGLAIASSIIERHGGSVEAKNRTGGGLEVTFRLPTRPRH